MTGFLIVLALAALLAGGVWYLTLGRRHAGPPKKPVFGTNPVIPEAHPQGKVPTLKMPTAMGWAPGQKPKAAPGLSVEPFAMGLKHPRWAYVLPNGDVLIAESASLPSKVTGFMDYAMNRVMRRAGAQRENANRITLLRDADGDGVPESVRFSSRA